MTGWSRLPLQKWKEQQKIDSSKQIRLVRLTHMRYAHPDFDALSQFLQDFGMHLVKRSEDKMWFRGYNSDPYVYLVEKGNEKAFLGGSWIVESYADLEKHVSFPGPIEVMNDSPGGGFRVTVYDPEGFPVNLIWGQEPTKTGHLPQRLVYNFENDKPREGTFQRFLAGPAAVHKLGHYGLCVKDLQAQISWYTTTFNLAPSDFMLIDHPTKPNEKLEVGFFAHIDRGSDFVDHHSFFMSLNATSHVHHCSLEVHDFDTQLLGHQWLAKRKYKSVWGVGRHILGSQIFDYWWDPVGFMIEHYTDGDTVNDKTPIGYGPAGNESLAVWGPDVPLNFLE
ncbi:Glyoxalase/Bleomycin resistance protein/Dihydroxybiphenyl dioxygenase [Bisporella sp. PMI_857]|nr:Glyoxalase/Bleomycin resistance protein/Dihydroxybiphenyl dioxygenase [Bisporella sp. PMI_857]